MNSKINMSKAEMVSQSAKSQAAVNLNYFIGAYYSMLPKDWDWDFCLR